MTYCLGMLLDDGLVMIADTRTNAGLDNLSTYQKLHCLAEEPGRQIYAASSGNLSASQNVLGLIEDGLPPAEEGEPRRTLRDAASMFAVAQLLGEALRIANKGVGKALSRATAGSCLLVGGRIGAGAPRLFLLYPEGNFIECKRDVPYLQIGETKYGRPILDRTIKRDTPLPTAVKVGLLSFDSAMRSNVAVARPLDLMVMPAESRRPVMARRIEKDDEYFNALSARWSAMLFQATLSIEDPDFMHEPEESWPRISAV